MANARTGGFGGGIISEANIAQQAEQVRASRFTGRLNELKLRQAQDTAARAGRKSNILAGAFGAGGQFDPQQAQAGLAAGGFGQEALDLRKVEQEFRSDEGAIAKTAAEASGEQLDSALKQAEIIGLGSLGLSQAFTGFTDQGASRDEAIQRVQPLYERVLQGMGAQGVDTNIFPEVFDPEITMAAVLSSKAGQEAFGAAKTRGLAERKQTEVERAATVKEEPSVSTGANELALELFDKGFNKLTKDQRRVAKQLGQTRKRSVAGATGLEAEKAKQKLLVTGKGAEAAGKASGIKVGIGNIGLLKDLILDKEGNIRKGNVLKSKLGVGVGRTINFLTSDTLSARLRLESGAVISKEELDEMAKRFTVSLFPPDSKELVALKFEKLEEFMNTADRFVDPSGIFNFASFNENFPSDLGKAGAGATAGQDLSGTSDEELLKMLGE